VKYRLRILHEPADVRRDWKSPEDLDSFLHQTIEDCDTEAEVVVRAHDYFPDGVAMPFPITIGSHQSVWLGVVPKWNQPVPSDGSPIHFAAFVQPLPQMEMDRAAIKSAAKKGRVRDVFDLAKWLTPVQKPTIMSCAITTVEVRTSDGMPHVIPATIGLDSQGRLVMHMKVDAYEFSVGFLPGVEISHVNGPNAPRWDYIGGGE
jgi:hypothetical protein